MEFKSHVLPEGSGAMRFQRTHPVECNLAAAAKPLHLQYQPIDRINSLSDCDGHLHHRLTDVNLSKVSELV